MLILGDLSSDGIMRNRVSIIMETPEVKAVKLCHNRRKSAVMNFSRQKMNSNKDGKKFRNNNKKRNNGIYDEFALIQMKANEVGLQILYFNRSFSTTIFFYTRREFSRFCRCSTFSLVQIFKRDEQKLVSEIK